MRRRKRRLKAKAAAPPARGNGTETLVEGGENGVALKLLIERMPELPVLSEVVTRKPKLSPVAKGRLRMLPEFPSMELSTTLARLTR